MSKNKKCVLCGNGSQIASDTFVCGDCEKENVESRYMNNWYA
jgi:ribosomal protein S27AE